VKLRTLAIVGGLAGLAGIAIRRNRLVEDLDWETAPKPGRIVDVDGYGVHIAERGGGPPMVLLHGFGGGTYHFDALAGYLSRTHRTIAVDLKGFGYSQRDAATGLSHTDQAEMLTRLLGQLGVERATIVGHSMGGAVAQRLAATHPELVDALVLIASAPAHRRFPRAAMRPAVLLRPLLPSLGKLAAERLLAASFYDRARLTPELREEYLRPARIRGSMDGLQKMLQDASNDEPVDLRRITQPVLLLYGADDPVAPLRIATELRRQMPHARLVVIDRAAHLLMVERPEECAAAIEEFLADARAMREAKAGA
jgi:pimeloyl-ACP methyl ester carboxylesterase